MGLRELPTIHRGSSIPELINFVRHSFRQCEFDEVQNTLMEREKDMKIEMLNLSRDRDSLKKHIEILETSLSNTYLEKSKMGKENEVLSREKLSLQEKLDSSIRKCEERDDRLASMEKDIEILETSLRNTYLEKSKMGKENEDLSREKLSLQEKLYSSSRKCEETDDRLARMEEEIEDMRRLKLSLQEKLDSALTICEEKSERLVRLEREIEELKGKDIEATRTIDELRVRLETALAKILCVNVEDLSKLVNGTDILDATTDAEEKSVNLLNYVEGGADCLGNDNVNTDAEDGAVTLPEVHATSDNSNGSGGVGSSKKGGRDVAHSGAKEAGAIAIRTLESAYSSTVAESNGIIQDNEGKAAEVKGSAAGNENMIVIFDSDDEAPGQSNKRSRTDDSPMDWSAKNKITKLEETETDSDDESCSDAYMDKLVDTFLSEGRNTK